MIPLSSAMRKKGESAGEPSGGLEKRPGKWLHLGNSQGVAGFFISTGAGARKASRTDEIAPAEFAAAVAEMEAARPSDLREIERIEANRKALEDTGLLSGKYAEKLSELDSELAGLADTASSGWQPAEGKARYSIEEVSKRQLRAAAREGPLSFLASEGVGGAGSLLEMTRSDMTALQTLKKRALESLFVRKSVEGMVGVLPKGDDYSKFLGAETEIAREYSRYLHDSGRAMLLLSELREEADPDKYLEKYDSEAKPALAALSAAERAFWKDPEVREARRRLEAAGERARRLQLPNELVPSARKYLGELERLVLNERNPKKFKECADEIHSVLSALESKDALTGRLSEAYLERTPEAVRDFVEGLQAVLEEEQYKSILPRIGFAGGRTFKPWATSPDISVPDEIALQAASHVYYSPIARAKAFEIGPAGAFLAAAERLARKMLAGTAPQKIRGAAEGAAEGAADPALAEEMAEYILSEFSPDSRDRDAAAERLAEGFLDYFNGIGKFRTPEEAISASFEYLAGRDASAAFNLLPPEYKQAVLSRAVSIFRNGGAFPFGKAADLLEAVSSGKSPDGESSAIVADLKAEGPIFGKIERYIRRRLEAKRILDSGEGPDGIPPEGLADFMVSGEYSQVDYRASFDTFLAASRGGNLESAQAEETLRYLVGDAAYNDIFRLPGVPTSPEFRKRLLSEVLPKVLEKVKGTGDEQYVNAAAEFAASGKEKEAALDAFFREADEICSAYLDPLVVPSGQLDQRTLSSAAESIIRARGDDSASARKRVTGRRLEEGVRRVEEIAAGSALREIFASGGEPSRERLENAAGFIVENLLARPDALSASAQYAKAVGAYSGNNKPVVKGILAAYLLGGSAGVLGAQGLPPEGRAAAIDSVLARIVETTEKGAVGLALEHSKLANDAAMRIRYGGSGGVSAKAIASAAYAAYLHRSSLAKDAVGDSPEEKDFARYVSEIGGALDEGYISKSLERALPAVSADLPVSQLGTKVSEAFGAAIDSEADRLVSEGAPAAIVRAAGKYLKSAAYQNALMTFQRLHARVQITQEVLGGTPYFESAKEAEEALSGLAKEHPLIPLLYRPVSAEAEQAPYSVAPAIFGEELPAFLAKEDRRKRFVLEPTGYAKVLGEISASGQEPGNGNAARSGA